MTLGRAISAVVLLAAVGAVPALPAPAVEVTQLMPGDILVSDAVGPVHLLDPDTGTHSLYAHRGPMVSAVGIAIAPGGDLVIADQGNASYQPPEPPKVVRVDRTTQQQVLVSTGGLLAEPTGVAVEADGDILVATRHGLVVVDPVNGAQRPLSAGSTRGVTVGPAGDILVTRADTVARIDPASGAATVLSAGGGLVEPHGLVVVPGGDIVVVDSPSNSLVTVDPVDHSQTVLQIGVDNPGTVAVEADGQLIVTGYPVEAGGTVHRVDPTTGAATLLSDRWGLDITSGVAIVPDHQPAAGSDAYRTDEDATLLVPAPGVLGNDVDPDGEPLTAHIVTRPAHGTLTLLPDGSFSYTPAADYHGPDSFSYAARGGRQSSEPATVQLTVTPVNDAPVAGTDRYRAIVTAPLLPLVVAAPGVLANDHDADDAALTAVAVSGPRHGRLTLRADGSFTYRPHLLYLGEDTFSYQAVDASGARSAVTRVSITIALL